MPSVLCTAAGRLILGRLIAGAQLREARWIVSLATFLFKTPFVIFCVNFLVFKVCFARKMYLNPQDYCLSS